MPSSELTSFFVDNEGGRFFREHGRICADYVDEVYASFGRGSLLSLGPGPAGIASRSFYGIIGGLGPDTKMRPRPKMGWTRSK